jgi:Na+-transporting NADH:ubiquinone oxidoreductase subunit NqrB
MATRATSQGLGQRILLATAIAGTLDIGMAAVETVRAGKPIGAMLRGVASGPLPAAADWGAVGAVAGLIVHYAIMAVMAALFLIAWQRIALVRRHAVLAALVYGVILWLVMYGLVLPLRFGMPFPSPKPSAIAKQLFAHVVLVGLTFGLVAKRSSA